MKRTEIAAIYFPSWHDEPRRTEESGPGFTEWELIKAGRPRFEGHRQPVVPAWGYLDETVPANMQRSCDAAAGAGVDAFLWDWYWYDGADFLNRPLNETFLGLPDPGIKFALMWANHDWVNAFPAHVGVTPELRWRGAISLTEFERMTQLVIERYFLQPSYWRVDGKAWFTIFRLDELVNGLGGVEAARAALADFRSRAAHAGAGELHLDVMGGYDEIAPATIVQLGIDSIGQYNWTDGDMPTDRGIVVEYADFKECGLERWKKEQDRQLVDYVPNVTMGWDSSSRVSQDDTLEISVWPYLPVVVDNTPESFEDAVDQALNSVRDNATRVVTINAWNEWTEGSYLEPDNFTGDAHLQALKRAVERERSNSEDDILSAVGKE